MKGSEARELLKDFPTDRFVNTILTWWNDGGKRDFPWRRTTDPYAVLISEIMLHRTKASQVVPVFKEFMEKYPDINSIGNSIDAELHQILHPLGLLWRTRMIKLMATKIVREQNGKIPFEYKELISLPGISDYIASATRCFAFGTREILLDTNTVRIVGRIFGLKINDASRRSKLFREILDGIVPKRNCKEFNYALIDFASKVCLPDPIDSACPNTRYCNYISSLRKF
jgi:A/G-specific adenine glycosylase